MVAMSLVDMCRSRTNAVAHTIWSIAVVLVYDRYKIQLLLVHTMATRSVMANQTIGYCYLQQYKFDGVASGGSFTDDRLHATPTRCAEIESHLLFVVQGHRITRSIWTTEL